MTAFKSMGLDARKTTTEQTDELDEAKVQFAAEQIANVITKSRSKSFKMMLVDQYGSFHTIEVTKEALESMRLSLKKSNQKVSVKVQIKKDTMSTQEAADLLKVSRPFIVSQIEKGILSCSYVGKFRRIAYEEVMRYRKEHMKRTVE